MRFLFNVKWRYLFNNFSLIKLIGRCYYLIAFLIILTCDLLILMHYNFQISLSVIMIIFAVLTIITFLRFIHNVVLMIMSRNYTANISNNIEHLSVSSGVPGCGKTSSRNYISVILAKRNWKQLKRDYWKCLNVPKNQLEQRLKDNQNEIIKAYNFAIENIDNFIPCLFSVQTIYIGKRQSNPLTKSMLLQRECLPFKCVLMVDEIGAIFPNKKRKDGIINNVELERLSDFCRFIRHFLDGYLIMTEQEFSKAFIDIRRVTGENVYFTKKQKWVLKPKLLLFIYDLLFSFFDWNLWKLDILKKDTKSYKKTKKQVWKNSKHWAKFMTGFARLIYCIGYRRYIYEKMGNSETTAKINTKKGRFYLPAPLNCKYNDRIYCNLYKAKDQELKQPQEQPFFPSKNDLLNRFGL